jgi:protein subunit release factor A
MVGTHRVQRVPATEKQGRRHSSTVTLIEVPDVDELAVAIDRRDVRFETFRASGAGGQHRNKTDSAVRLRHVPTGIEATATQDRSQHRNRIVAWQRLTAAIATEQRATAMESADAVRAGQFGAARSWTWCGWRDQVTSPSGQHGSMRRAMAGDLAHLIA